jgi:hypothetical protein
MLEAFSADTSKDVALGRWLSDHDGREQKRGKGDSHHG